MVKGITASSAAILVVVVSLGSHGIQGHLPDRGDCSFKEYTCMWRNCSTMFYRDLKNHPDDCSGAFLRIKPCLKNVVKVCLGSLLNDDQLGKFMNDIFKEKEFCSSGPLELPKDARPGVPGVVLPCAQNFMTVVANCEKPFYDKYRANKADSALCSSFATAKKCDLAATQSLCNFTPTLKGILVVILDDYNPFCTSEIDPGATGPGYCDAVVIPTLDPSKSPSDFGLCPLKEYICSALACSTIFYRGLQKNPDDCSGVFLGYRSCMKRILKICIGSGLDDDQLDAVVNARVKEEQVCGVESASYWEGLPCGQNFPKEAKRCEQPFIEKFKTNNSDSALCSSHATAKQCLKSASDSMCSFTSPAKEMWEAELGDYNPFCTSERDPGATGPGYCDAVVTPSLAPTKLPSDIGLCPFKKYVCSVHACSTIFYRGLQKNDCSGLVLEFRSCMKGILKICHGSAMHDHQLDRDGIKEDQMCAVGPLEIPAVTHEAAFSCGQNSLTEAKRCEQPFNEKFKTNKADSALCSSYATAKNCLKSATDSMCNFTSYKVKEGRVASLGDYNPFCNSERDPGATGPGYCDGVAIITPARASAAAGQSAKPAFCAFAVLFGAAVVDQFL